MEQLEKLKLLLDNPNKPDELLQFYLDDASEVICKLRNSDKVESKYLTTQLKIAVELYNKRGVEGQTSHGENGISRVYEASDISRSLLKGIVSVGTTPFSTVRVIEE